ncbi:hypothetical protein AVV36_gp127 [Pectobacterium bacteriophage PM2]|uniref:Acb2/Tad1 hairpin domain-containing protein n=1 Tax=Pectobacterium bacteriophage PM2 TaxID=1429794 RepID=A0A0A0PZH6_9CAUD|nr:hypothetical protein AVV36_gp127 [Pectobacterium bacteriophage PM2]AHY25089.1 hypothetical protein PM2_127 [Pectobacterium bacteriophage PM2]
MAIKDIKGYQPHSDEKIELVNRIKEAENALGQIFKEIQKDLLNKSSCLEGKFQDDNYDVLDDLERVAQVRNAIQHLKEASMWGCRAVFRPTESY